MPNNPRNVSSAANLWGKLRKNEADEVDSWLSIADHCTDVAFVFRALCDRSAMSRALNLAARKTLSSVQLDRLAVLALLHDFGKCNHGFQAKALKEPQQVAGHVREIAPLIFDPSLQERFLQELSFSETLGRWFGDPEDALRMLLASVSHHGRPVPLEEAEVARWRPLWLAQGVDPIRCIGSLMEVARMVFPAAFSNESEPMPAPPALQHRFAGLVMLADWLGSHADSFFPFEHRAASRAEFARTAAERAVKAVGLDADVWRQNSAPMPGFRHLFGFEPRPLQATLNRDLESSILVAESDTGSGKTEAALAHFIRLFSSGVVDSLYFALPTRVAATELYDRVLRFAKAAFGDDHPPVLLAVPGYARVDGEDMVLPTPEYLWQDDARARSRERAWSAERPKRFLAATLAVGTIDQALLSVMQANHAHLRAVCLERSLLVVDEVHASDVYMRGLLRALLEEHQKAGGRSLLLSATLGSDARAELMAPRGTRHRTPSLTDAIRTPYPSITRADGVIDPIGSVPGRSKSVDIETVACLSEPGSMIPRITEAVENGGRVLLVLNTVARAVAFMRAAETNPLAQQYLFSVEGVRCPHHGRFARADRHLLDRAVTNRLGKAGPRHPILLVGTQTLEQSLDIDADWLVTDLCPMDVLLQRIGRLHRHDRERPAAFSTPTCTVLAPEDTTLESFFRTNGSVRGLAGLGVVYPDLRVARLTLEYIGEHAAVSLPADNRQLVEAATHPEQLAQFDYGHWIRHSAELNANAMAQSLAAQNVLMDKSLAFGDPNLRFRAMGEKITTRLGLEDRRIPLDEPVLGPFGVMIEEIGIPGWMAKHCYADKLDSPPEVDSRLIRFRYGSREYHYSRYGLELGT